MTSIKISFVIPEDIYRELKRRVAEENRLIKSIVKTLIEYLSKNKTVKKQNIN